MVLISTPLPLRSPNTFHSTPLRALISQEAKEAVERNERNAGLLLGLSDGLIVHLSALSRERKKVRGDRRVEAFQATIFEWWGASSPCACSLPVNCIQWSDKVQHRVLFLLRCYQEMRAESH